MKKLFGAALLALPFLTASVHATGNPFALQMGGCFYIKGGPSQASPQAGPWYLYWPLEAHFVAPAPTGYPYWPSPMGLPATAFGGPSCPPGVPVPPPAVATAPAPAAPNAPAAPAASAPAQAPAMPPAPPAAPQAVPKGILPPYLQPTSYSPTGYPGQVPSYWYDR